jgi:hypothetical protein
VSNDARRGRGGAPRRDALGRRVVVLRGKKGRAWSIGVPRDVGATLGEGEWWFACELTDEGMLFRPSDGPAERAATVPAWVAARKDGRGVEAPRRGGAQRDAQGRRIFVLQRRAQTGGGTAWAITVPTEVGDALADAREGEWWFACELTDEGMLFRPSDGPQPPRAVLPAGACEEGPAR